MVNSTQLRWPIIAKHKTIQKTKHKSEDKTRHFQNKTEYAKTQHDNKIAN